jgi:ABC-type transport system involved in cytochrome bd biosynthesis fused ATPase/permease subunit
MNTFQSLKERYLVCDAGCPILSSGSLADEMLLYNLNEEKMLLLTQQFLLLTGKELSPSSKTEELSGGQKVILMCLLALYSPARAIALINLERSLDAHRRNALQAVIQNLAAGREIILRETDET